MPGTIPLSGLQLGVETTAGTAVATTRELYPDSTGYLDPGIQQSFGEGRQSGTFSNVTMATRTGVRPTISFATEPSRGVAFDELVYFGSQLVKGVTGTGTGADKTWVFDSTEIAHTFDTFTANAFTATQAWEVDNCAAESMSLSGGFDDMTQMSIDLVGQDIAKVTVDAVAANDAVLIPSGLWTLKYATAQAGLTAAGFLANTLRSWQIDIDTGINARGYADGTLAMGQHVASGNQVGTIQMTWDDTSDATVQYDNYAAQTVSFFRLEATGPSLGGSNYKATIDVAVLWEDVTPMASESDGVVETTMEGRLVYDATWTNAISLDLVGSLAALP